MAADLRDLIVVGAGGHARIVIDAAEASGVSILGVIDIDYKNQNEEILNYQVLGDFSVLQDFDSSKVRVVIAVGDGHERANYFGESEKMGFSVGTITHPAAIVSKHARVGRGAVINSGAIINARAEIGENTIINTGAIIDHEVKVGRHSHIGPGVKIAGRVTVGDFTFIGIGATVIDKITIGDNVVIGAGSTIIHNVESNSTVVGVPGKRIK